jgi:putative ABC transport system substrate-binding protein
MQVTRAAVTDAAELERAVDAFAQQPNAALIVLPNIVTVLHRDLIIALAARHRLPAVYPYRAWARRRAVKQASLSVTRFYFAGDCARLMNGRIFN